MLIIFGIAWLIDWAMQLFEPPSATKSDKRRATDQMFFLDAKNGDAGLGVWKWKFDGNR